MKNLKIGVKLAIAFGTVWLIVIGLALSSITSIILVAKQTDEFYATAHASSVTAWQARRDIRYLESRIYKTVATSNPQKGDVAISEATKAGESFIEALNHLKRDLPEKETTINKALDIAKVARPKRDLVLELALANRNDEAMKVMDEEYAPQLENIINLISEVGIFAEQEAKGFVDSAAKSSDTVMIVMTVISAVAAIYIIVLTTSITKSIAIPAKKISERIVKLSDGDLDSPMPVINSKDEIGVLAQGITNLVTGIHLMISDMLNVLTQMSIGNFAVEQADIEYKGDFAPLQTAINQILKSLNSTLLQINIASDEVSNGADQVSTGAQALSQGATEQASSVEELSASIFEISEKVNANAINSKNASIMANSSAQEIINSNTEMQVLAGAINEINEKSHEIEKIIKTIQDIAFQTNILALNAAVEAARAGAAGKGFAVVADEVRNLAGKSSEAAKTTTTLIGESIKAVQNGTKLAHETANSLIGIVDGANETTKLIAQLTTASEEQAIAIKQINIGIEQISAVVQTNSATSEESAAASEELSSQADLLKGLVNKFHLKA